MFENGVGQHLHVGLRDPDHFILDRNSKVKLLRNLARWIEEGENIEITYIQNFKENIKEVRICGLVGITPITLRQKGTLNAF